MLHTFLQLAARACAALRPGHFDRDLEDELASHIAMAEDDYVRGGMSRDEARRLARLKLGGVTQLADAHREIRGVPLAHEFVTDVRYGVRALARNPGVGAVAIFVLAIGIGANTAMFSVLHGVLLQPLTYPESDRVVFIRTRQRGWNRSAMAVVATCRGNAGGRHVVHRLRRLPGQQG
jgi:hypothetical protein